MTDTNFRLKKIMVVDDEGDLLSLARTRLEKSGYKVMTLEDGACVQEVAKSERPDLILLDVMMTDKSGWDVCRELKADESTRGIPVIVCTAYYPGEEYVKRSSGEAGADDYILKPFEAQALLAKIKLLIK
ncbi:MAG: response regulator [Candidatus Aureabacteria bacterium]|nr:response regulator [Candidatus Auribacterota bacterium]